MKKVNLLNKKDQEFSKKSGQNATKKLKKIKKKLKIKELFGIFMHTQNACTALKQVETEP